MEQKRYIVLFRWVLALLYGVGVAGFSVEWSYELFVWLTPLNLLVTVVLLLWAHQGWDAKSVFLFVLIYGIGFLAELVGVHTRLLFGNYSYGAGLGVKIFETPLMIGFNWLVLAYGVYALLDRFWGRWWLPFVGGVLMVIFDFVMEPVAISLNLWAWEGEQIPLKNYLDWYLVSCLIFMLMVRFRFRPKNGLAVWILMIQFIFFLTLNFILKPL